METVCIVCPNGCRLNVAITAKGAVVTGNKCPKGEAYGREEATDPRRVVTAVVRTASAKWPCVPVRTDRAVPKKLIPRLLKTLYAMQVKVPVRRGETLVRDFHKTGANVVFTRTVPPVTGPKAGGR
jgi:CxxC motif-containing protein